MAPKYTLKLKRDSHGRWLPAKKSSAKKATKNARRKPPVACKQNNVVTKAQYAGREWECCGQGKGKARKLVCHPVTEALRKRREAARKMNQRRAAARAYDDDMPTMASQSARLTGLRRRRRSRR